MNTIGRVSQWGAALWIVNVWFNRYNKDTGYRGGGAKNMREEFANYGIPPVGMFVVGAIKVGLAVLMIVGTWVPRLVRPASIGLALFMVGAISMHIKVNDPIKRSAPAITVLTLSVISALLAGTKGDTD